MTRALAALALAVSIPALGAETGTVLRRDLVRADGTVEPEDVFRLKSPIDGRIEGIAASSFTWRSSTETLATLASSELAAMIDTRGELSEEIMEDRWHDFYHPVKIHCADGCFVLKVSGKMHSWVKSQAVLFEAASRLKLVGHVRPEDATLMRAGLPMTFWAVKDPKRKLRGRIASFSLDDQSGGARSGGTFTAYLSPDRSLNPGTEWAGYVVPAQKATALLVPTRALIHYRGAAYLTLRVSTGAVTNEYTQIIPSPDWPDQFLIPAEDAQSPDAEPARPPARKAAPPAPEAPAPAPVTEKPIESEEPPAPPKAPQPLQRRPPSDDKDFGGEDPYGQQ